MFDGSLNQLIGEADKQFTLADGELIFRVGTQVRHVHVVLEGRAHLVRHSRDGAALVLQRAREGEVIAVASMFAARYHCDAVAHGAARLARVPRQRVDELQARTQLGCGRWRLNWPGSCSTREEEPRFCP